MTEMLSKEEFRTQMEEAIKGRHSQAAPFSVAWAEGKLQRKHFARWAENHYHYVGPFADYLGYIYGNTSDKFEEAKDFLLQNMYEEEISDVRHTDLLIRFAEACGTTADRVKDDNNMLPTTRGLQSWCYALAMREHFVVASAALIVGLESQVPAIYKKQLPPLLDKYGFSEEEAEFFSLHIVSDEIHGERGFQIVLDHADTPELQQRCLKVIRDGAAMRWAYMDGLYRAYVQPDVESTVTA
ncbi:TenA family transcriptional regulator [Alicyclobacillus sp. SO9]|uniref:TenA family transcriptional regulator n=1 Tax=Alicyclobacillus sp. SO9 TaxID=2665646 RepID=UPI0018E893E3|nr:iron-containing redox enzyme family protein [Alicyclobacillus sp. SO9]QQE78660.1 iron-containing redox enzyme family protein [Alicyclobacillus sp. SO9]